jgi:hypothetical protein
VNEGLNEVSRVRPLEERPSSPHIEFRGQVTCGKMGSPNPSGREPEGGGSK